MMRGAVLALALAGAVPAWAGGTLIDRIVTFRVLAYDDPSKPIFDGRGETVRVGGAVEFGLYPEGAQNGFDVIPVQVNISAARIEVSYAMNPPNRVYPAEFNGYVLSFNVDCALFDAARIDPAATNMDVTDEDLRFEGDTLYINVSGAEYDTDSRFAVDLGVTDCPLS